MNNDSIIQKIGGRKFLLSLIVLIAIIAIALAAPTALSTELILGLLGVIATYSGSNSVITALALKKAPAPAAEVIDVPAEKEQQSGSDLEARISNLEQRMAQNEATTAEVVDILKKALTPNIPQK